MPYDKRTNTETSILYGMKKFLIEEYIITLNIILGINYFLINTNNFSLGNMEYDNMQWINISDIDYVVTLQPNAINFSVTSSVNSKVNIMFM